MTVRVVFRSSAKEDLRSITFHIAKDSIERAEAFVSRIEKRCLELAEFAGAGRSREDLGPGLRTVSVEKRAVIAYVVGSTETETEIEIVRVLYGGRDVDSLLRSVG